ncbi:tetratricopeptide repeat protein [Methylomonas sp. DH-1]|uniref:tetratricopeptide repeat protein n=1 Tax=Methylomonas sp. (strain DH-1) TaxID=1727196 RepID=UPI000A64F283|nr:hypothetical protein [Methylomonas sp. DH-1]
MTLKLPADLDQLKQLAETEPKAQFTLAWFYLPEDVKQKMDFIDERYKEYWLAGIFDDFSIRDKNIVFPIAHEKHDLDKAFNWLKKAAESDFEAAYYPFAQLCFDASIFSQALEYSVKSKESDFAEGFCLLGNIYQTGSGVKQDHRLAYEYYKTAFRKGYKRSHAPYLSLIFINGFESDISWYPNKLDEIRDNSQELLIKLDCYAGKYLELLESNEWNEDFIDEQEYEKNRVYKSIKFNINWLVDTLNGVSQSAMVAKNNLLAKERELEETMAMFAHKFRSPLDAIIYNTEHEHQEKLYRQAAQTMRGLLDIFSLVATDADKLQDRLKQDCRGNGNLITAFSKVLDMVLLHLLSVSAKGLIRQHYLRYAKAQGLCDMETSSKQWYENCRELEQKLQQDWELSYAQLLGQSATLAQRLAWLESHFFKLELLGFERDDIRFDEYEVTESLLTIVLNEFLVNVFKYYASGEKESVVLEWISRDGHQVLACRNPSTRHDRTRIKGSGKGHVFLSALAGKIGSEFIKPNPADNFVVEFSLADELLISN